MKLLKKELCALRRIADIVLNNVDFLQYLMPEEEAEIRKLLVGDY